MSPQINWSELCDEALGEFRLTALPTMLKLPALPLAVTQFLEKSKDPDACVKELSRLIETDAGLTLELLRHVNSAYVGLRNKAGNVQQAISLLGIRQAKMFIISNGMQSAVKARQSRLIHQAGFWTACLQKALFAREVAKLLKTDVDTAFSGALLQDYLLPILTNEMDNQYVTFFQDREKLPECLTDFEDQTFQWNHALAGASLARKWNLPDELVGCILFHHFGLRILCHAQMGRSPVAAVAISALLPDQLRQHTGGLDLLLKLGEKWKAFDLLELAHRVDEQHAEMGLGVRNDFPLSRRCAPSTNSAESTGSLIAGTVSV
jgi:HD-like signal output (HDOD) protein